LEERGELKALVAEMYQDHKSSSLDNIWREDSTIQSGGYQKEE
jgi:hypothetical protein